MLFRVIMNRDKRFEAFADAIAWQYMLTARNEYSVNPENVEISTRSDIYEAGVMFAAHSINESTAYPIFEEMESDEKSEAIQ